MIHLIDRSIRKAFAVIVIRMAIIKKCVQIQQKDQTLIKIKDRIRSFYNTYVNDAEAEVIIVNIKLNMKKM